MCYALAEYFEEGLSFDEFLALTKDTPVSDASIGKSLILIAGFHGLNQGACVHINIKIKLYIYLIGVGIQHYL